MLTPAHEQDTTQDQFWAEFNSFEFRVFILLNWLPYEVLTVQFVFHCWRENSRIYTLSECISALGNVDGLSKIRNRVAESIFVDGNQCMHVYIYIYRERERLNNEDINYLE